MNAAALLLAVAAVAGLRCWWRERRHRRGRVLGRFAGGEAPMHYVRHGNGPTVVMLHGNVGDLGIFTSRLVPLAATTFDCIAVDRPGHGRSPRRHTFRSGRPSAQAHQLHAVLRELDVDAPILVCHSWACFVGLAYAIEYPEQVSGLLLVGPVGFTDKQRVPPSELRSLTLVPVLGPLVWRVIAGFARPLFRATSEVIFWPDRPDAHVIDDLLSLDFDSPAQVRASTIDFTGAGREIASLSARYAEIMTPVHLLAGEDDWVAPPDDQATPLGGRLVNSRVQLVPDAGHMLPVTHPEVVLDAIHSVHTASSELRR